MKRIAILGANGRLGNEVLHAFHAAGYHVTAVTRNGQVREAPAAVKRVAADAMNLRQLKKAVRGADFIFNGLNPPYTQWVHTALPMARNVMEATCSNGAVHLFPGNVYNYGKNIPAVCDSNTPMQADSVKGKIRIEMERLFSIAAQKYRIQTLIIRAGDFYGGSGKRTWFDLALVDKLEKGQFVYPGPDDVTHAWAYLPDLAKAFVALANEQQCCQPFENLLYPGHNFTGAELKVLAEKACAHELTLLGLPWRLIKLGRLLVPMWREIYELSYLWERPHQLVCGRLAEIIGEVPETAPELAVRDALWALGKVK